VKAFDAADLDPLTWLILHFLRYSGEGMCAHRNNMNIEVSLSALLFAPFRKLRVSGGDKSKSSGGDGSITHLGMH
jgi:hypothetical protein